MAHRTRRRAVLRERRERVQEREHAQLENIAIDKFKRELLGFALRSERIRYDDLPDARGAARAQQLREWARRDWAKD